MACHEAGFYQLAASGHTGLTPLSHVNGGLGRNSTPPTPMRARMPADLIGFSRLPPTRVVREYSRDAGQVRASDPAPVQY